MSIDHVLIVGAGGHAKVVLDALLLMGGFTPSVMDDNPALNGTTLLQTNVCAPLEESKAHDRYFHIAIGSNAVRAELFARFIAAGGKPLTITHPAACISAYAQIEAGAFIAAHAVVAPSARIGAGAIINHGAIIDHDCVVGPHTHIAPQASLAGGVHIGEQAMIGAGANILPGLKIDVRAIIGAGAVLRQDVGPDALWAGVPAILQQVSSK
ncbi:acetyltransferase [Achromobacter spanius]|jgi:sugar O-acyltransferase (sialic acid O-acetyltransferase NeuD family)|uniref:acetyltransferase n=1 Tax=Achromobacter spanius TaxID=217203 RepID=UPI002227B6FF|nr:acetyltransferase [Achromobacter spanius]MCW3151044.1 acetyltransferase [Achromobacter spanius]